MSFWELLGWVFLGWLIWMALFLTVWHQGAQWNRRKGWRERRDEGMR